MKRAWIGFLLEGGAILFLIIGVAPFLHLDEWRLGMLLTYPPRAIAAVLAALGTALALFSRRYLALAAYLFAALLAGAKLDLALPATEKPLAVPLSPVLKILAFNTQHMPRGAAALADFARRQGPDILVLQEVTEQERPALEAVLRQEYDFIHPDTDRRFTHDNWGPYSNLIALRKVSGLRMVERHPAITDYRTFAVKLASPGRPDFFLVNVHNTKAFWNHEGVAGFFLKADYKSAWHYEERRLLADWLAPRMAEPIVIAGDFNAPACARESRFEGFEPAQRVAGTGVALSWPSAFPVIDLDHALGNAPIRFQSYRQIQSGMSDHLAQLFSFSIAAPALAR